MEGKVYYEDYSMFEESRRRAAMAPRTKKTPQDPLGQRGGAMGDPSADSGVAKALSTVTEWQINSMRSHMLETIRRMEGPKLAPQAGWGADWSAEALDKARAEGAAAERERIMAALQMCKPTETVYSRRDWAIEERGKRDLWAKIMKALGEPVKEGP